AGLPAPFGHRRDRLEQRSRLRPLHRAGRADAQHVRQLRGSMMSYRGDLLVRLYDLPDFPAEAKVAAAGIVIRRALPPERHVILDWIERHFYKPWVSEAALAMSQQPPTLWVAI